MDPQTTLHVLLGTAVLLPLFSFFIILVLGPRLGKGGAYVATGAILGAAILSFISLFAVWLPVHWPQTAVHPSAEQDAGHSKEHDQDKPGHEKPSKDHADSNAESVYFVNALSPEKEHGRDDSKFDDAKKQPAAEHAGPAYYTGDYYLLGKFGELRLTISYYIDSLTLIMFCMVTLIATCIHFYAMGYMHEELHEVTDHEVTTSDGSHLKRPGRYYRFFQYLSLFCFSMLGLVLAGNIAMVFVFWELVGICSYFLIGFYIERKSASNAANKAFIVNRVGDIGMIIGLMALWAGMGTFAFGDYDTNNDGKINDGLFSLVRPDSNHNKLQTPAGLVRMGASEEVAKFVLAHPDKSTAEIENLLNEKVSEWRNDDPNNTKSPHYGYGLLIVGGLGIFCGCVGKSAQFPLHVWLPDAMEGPTPVSALVHSATMVAAGVYLVGRFFPVFAPEVLLIIAASGCITLFMAATIAITATDIKRVLAYSTISQLGYMMLALGLGGWVAGLMHLVTHAFFKSLLFMCSGSVIHAVHTNEMPEMGGLLKKMPYTAITMLIGCLAISGVGIPMIIFGGSGVGLSGFYSKDLILEQAFSFMQYNDSPWAAIFFLAALGGAAITAFYMFRLWFLTFMGKPRNQHRYDHAHESPKVMYVPLIILSVFAGTVAWTMFDFVPGHELSLNNLIGSSAPLGALDGMDGVIVGLHWPAEHKGHVYGIAFWVTMLATSTWLLGIGLAAAFYWKGYLDPEEVRKKFAPIHRFLVNKWWFDELYDWVFIKPTHVVARVTSAFDRRVIDGIIHFLARATLWFTTTWEMLADQIVVDGVVNLTANWVHSLGLALRKIQTGKLRQYVLFIVIGTITIFLLVSFLWGPTLAG